MGRQAFGIWLRKQWLRNDPVGDLANQLRMSGFQQRSVAGVRSVLDMHDAFGFEYTAFEQAVEEWGGE